MEKRDPHGGKAMLEKHRIGLVFWISVLLVILIGGVLILDRNVAITSVAEVPLVSKSLPDGATFEVLQTEAGATYTFEGRRPERRISLVRLATFWKKNSDALTLTRSTYGWSFFDFETISKRTAIDQAECRLKDRDCNALFLLVRLKNAAGGDIVSAQISSDETDAPVEIHWDKNDVFKEITMVPRSTHPAPQPLYRIEVEDGAGGWLTTNGPLAFDARDGRSVVIATVYPRRNPTLKLRIVQNDVVHSFIVEIPNPGYSPGMDPTWKADPEPREYKTSDATVAVTEVDSLFVSKRRKPLPTPRFQVRTHAVQPPTAFHIQILSIEDSMGNRTPIDQFRLLPHESILRYHCLIRRSPRYQWSIPEVTFVAEGTWSGGLSVELLNPLPAALDFGIAEMTFAPAPTPKIDDWIFSFQGNAPSANLPDRSFVVFFDGEESPRVASSPFMGSSNGPTLGAWTYDFIGKWEGRITPGQRFRLGLVPEIEAEAFYATLAVPAKFLKANP